MYFTMIFHPAKDDGIDSTKTDSYDDRSWDEPKVPVSKEVPDGIVATSNYIASVATPRFGRWLHMPETEAEHFLPDFPDHPWILTYDRREILGISACQVLAALHEVTGEITNSAQVSGKLTTLDLRPTQIAYFKSIHRQDLIF